MGHAAEEDAAQVVAALLQQRVDHFRRGRGFREDHDDARPGRLRGDAGVNLHFERAALELLRLAVEQKQADLTLRFSRSGGDESAARSVPLQHSGADEAVDRLVDGHVSDPVLLAEVALGGQFFAGPVDARQDLLVQEAAELLVFRRIAHRFSFGKKVRFLYDTYYIIQRNAADVKSPSGKMRNILRDGSGLICREPAAALSGYAAIAGFSA